MKHLLFILHFPEFIIVTFFILMTVIGLTHTLSAEGIDPRPVQVAGYLLVTILSVRLVATIIDHRARKKRARHHKAAAPE